MTILCLLVAVAGCGSGKPHAERLIHCLRDSGAKVEALPPASSPGANEAYIAASPGAMEAYQVTLSSDSFAVVEVVGSKAEARRRLTTGAIAVRKGRTVVGYAGSREHDAAVLESCLRSSTEAEA